MGEGREHARAGTLLLYATRLYATLRDSTRGIATDSPSPHENLPPPVAVRFAGRRNHPLPRTRRGDSLVCTALLATTSILRAAPIRLPPPVGSRNAERAREMPDHPYCSPRGREYTASGTHPTPALPFQTPTPEPGP